MASTYTFLKSPLGARVKSPLGAFQCSVIGVLEIFTVPVFLIETETYVVTGEYFGSIQGVGLLEISNTPDFDDVVVIQSVSLWTDDSITFNYDSMGLLADGIVWIHVVSDSGQHDQLSSSISVVYAIGSSSGFAFLHSPCFLDHLENYSQCDRFQQLATSGYCSVIKGNTLIQKIQECIINTPQFILHGKISGMEVELSAPSFATATTIDYCSIVGGLAALFDNDDSLVNGIMNIYGPLSFWIFNEHVLFFSKFPASIQITSPPSGNVSRNCALNGYAYAAEGDIGTNIIWSSDIDGVLGVGALLNIELTAGAHVIESWITNAHGQQRFANVSITAIDLSIASIAAASGSSAGGDSVTITGNGFSPAATVAFDGVPATSVVVVGLTSITCVTPAHFAGAVDVVVTDVSLTATLPSGYTYV